MAFKIGDKVTGKGKGDAFIYTCTDSDAVMGVMSTNGNLMRVMVLSHNRRPETVRQTFIVEQKHFKLIRLELKNK